MKTCNACKAEKPLTEFYSDARLPDGYRYLCKTCNVERVRAWQIANPERFKARRKAWDDRQSLAKKMWRTSKRRAKDYDVEFAITVEDVEPLLVSGHCAVSGLPFDMSSHRRNPRAPTMDRIDSSKGYVKGNIRVVNYCINMSLNNWGLEEAAFIWAAALGISKRAAA